MPKDKKEDSKKKAEESVETPEVPSQDDIAKQAEQLADKLQSSIIPDDEPEEEKAPEPEPAEETAVSLDEEIQQIKNEIPGFNSEESKHVDTVTVQPVEFVSFENDDNPVGGENQNLEMLLDIKLELTVELGRCELPIKKILELTRDSIIELDKIAGEPVSLYANGKHIANGEVVVIEDNFGLRITSIIEPEKRLKSLE